jgi:hypothetical protein
MEHRDKGFTSFAPNVEPRKQSQRLPLARLAEALTGGGACRKSPQPAIGVRRIIVRVEHLTS